MKYNFQTKNSKYTSQNEIFEYDYSHPNVLFNFLTSTQNLSPNSSFISNLNHYIDQSQAMLLMTLGFLWNIKDYTVV